MPEVTEVYNQWDPTDPPDHLSSDNGPPISAPQPQNTAPATPTIRDIRKQFPQYQDLSDQQLSDAIHAKFYPDMPKPEFETKIGLVDPSKFKGGAGYGFSDQVSNALTLGLARPMYAGVKALGPLLTGGDAGQAFSQGEREYDAAKAQYENAHPIISKAGSLIGGVSALGPNAAAPVVTSLLGRVAQGAPAGAIAGGIQSAANANGSVLDRAAAGAKGAAIGAVTGGAINAGAGAAADRLAASGAAKLAPTIDAVRAAADAGYKDPAIARLAFTPQATTGLARSIKNDLTRARFTTDRAPQTQGALDDLANAVKQTPRSITPVTLQGLDETRQVLGRIAGNFNEPLDQAAASRAIDAIDNYTANIPQSHVLWGDPQAATAALTAARGNYASAQAAQRVGDKLYNAELQAASAHSGGNIDNATRQKLRTLLTSRKAQRGFTPQELDQLDQAVRGSTVGNALRVGGKLLGGGGGMHAFGSAAVGGAFAGPLGIATPIAGYAMKRAGDALTKQAADRVVNTILARSPLGQSMGAAPKPYALPPPAFMNPLLPFYPAQKQPTE